MNSNATTATPPWVDHCRANPNDPTATMAGEFSRWLLVGIGIFLAMGVFRLVDRLEQFQDGLPQDTHMGAYLLAKEIENIGLK